MPHVRARLYDKLIRRLDVFGGDGADVPALRARFERAAPVVWPWLGIRTSPVLAGGVPGEWVVTKRSIAGRVLLYLHGGGWFMGSPRTHRSLVAELVRAARVRGLTLDYRLAPEHPYPAALDDCVAAYEWLLASGIGQERIVVAGDSAGGNLAMALPLQADLRGLPPMLVHVGDHEVLRDDAVRLGERATAAGVEARAVVWPGMVHVFQVFAPYVPDARRANQEIADFIRARTAA